MAKRVFFSFDYEDVETFRANVVRQHWVTKPDREEAGFFDASIWEEAKRKGPEALKRLINDALENTSVTGVLIGSDTYNRRWVKYEIVKSIVRGNRVIGIHINNIKDKYGQIKLIGSNPFDHLALAFGQDGKTARFLEYVGSQWINYADYPAYNLKDQAPVAKWGSAYKLSDNHPVYNWVLDDGYENFSEWVEPKKVSY